MTEYLLAIHIGPVQEFIAAARRTADLWAGSRLLLDVVGTVARCFSDNDRVFPVDPTAGGANRVLTFVTGDPATHLTRAKQAAEQVLVDAWQQHTATLSADQKKALDLELGMRQVRGFIEVLGAWTPLSSRDDYPAARERVELLLRGRKATRDFAPRDDEPTGNPEVGLPKSPLDPSLPTIRRRVEQPQLRDQFGAHPLFMKETESLDAISVLKRIKGVKSAGEVHSTRTLAERARDPEARDTANSGGDPDAPDEEAPGYSYFAVLVADGDRMGQHLNQLAEHPDAVTEHRQFGRTLDQFAQSAEALITSHGGQPVYCGGDDVMAFLPVTQVLACARALHREFAVTVDGTLSAGIAIVHYKEPLSVSLARARQAEQTAKQIRDAVCVALHTRGGTPRMIRQHWSELRLDTWQAHFAANVVPYSLPYELSRLALTWSASLPATALAAESQRIIERKIERTPESVSFKDELASFIENRLASGPTSGLDATAAERLHTVAQELIMSRFLAGAATQKEETR